MNSVTEKSIAECMGFEVEELRNAVLYDALYPTECGIIMLRPEAEAQAVLARAHEAGSDTVIFIGVVPRTLIKNGVFHIFYAATTPPSVLLAVAFARGGDQKDEIAFWQKVGADVRGS